MPGQPAHRCATRTRGRPVATTFGRFAVTSPLSRLLALRSDGIKDLARGHPYGTRWQADKFAVDQQAAPLPLGIRQYFVTGTLTRLEGSLYGRLVGDLVVLPSSSGDRQQNADHQWLGGMHHLQLLRHDRVYDALRRWLCEGSAPDGQDRDGVAAVRRLCNDA